MGLGMNQVPDLIHHVDKTVTAVGPCPGSFERVDRV